MKVMPKAGLRTDFPPYTSTAFWLYGENVRFRHGYPETIGLFAKIVDGPGGNPVQITLTDPDKAEMWSDRDLLLIGHGSTCTVVNWETGSITALGMPNVSTTGRWWFSGGEKEIFVGRAGLDGYTYQIDRATLSTSQLANAPMGGIAGGITSELFVQAGTQGAGYPENKMVVRWSSRRRDETGTADVGFEDWDITTSLGSTGELLLEGGSTIVGGGPTDLGFVVFTDTHTHLLVPRADLYVFSSRKVANRGMISSHAWAEADGRIWWYDQALVLNVMDGGGVQQIPNTMRMSSVETIDSDNLDRIYMSADGEYGEVIMHYPTRDGRMRSLVYNYIENAWYSWALDRISWTDRLDPRPSVAIDPDGFLYTHDLREAFLSGYLNPRSGITVGPAPWGPSPKGLQPGQEVEEFDFFLMTNLIAPEDPTRQSLRTRNVVVNHLYGQPPGSMWADDYTLRIISRGRPSLDGSDDIIDEAANPIGEMVFFLRSGGKSLQYVLEGKGIRTFMRFGEISDERDDGGKR